MADGLQPALVLDQTVAADEAVHFANFPGLWLTGHPVAVSELGFADADAAFAKVAEFGLPLEQTDVADGEGQMPQVANRLPGADEARASGWTPAPGQPGAALGPGEVFPPAPDMAAAEQLAVVSILDMNAADAVTAIGMVETATELAALAASEEAGKNRSTVLKAVSDRQTQLNEPAAADETDEVE